MSKKEGVSEQTYLLCIHYGPMLVRRCYPARAENSQSELQRKYYLAWFCSEWRHTSL